MQFKSLTTLSLPLQPQLHWLLYSPSSRGFVVGDEQRAFLLPEASPDGPVPLEAPQADAGAIATHPCNLPVPRAMFDELAVVPWHGFRFLDRAGYDGAKDAAGQPVGDWLRTLVFGPDYGHYLTHPASGAVFALRSGSIEMLRAQGGGFASMAKAKTKGRAALAFAAHPREGLIAYGDNAGTFHAQRFDADGFGKASKVATKERKASCLEFINAGQTLVIGGMGYLETYACESKGFIPRHQLAIAVRDALWLNDGAAVLVNQGLNGVSSYAYGPSGFEKRGAVQPDGAVRHLAISIDGRYLAATEQDTAKVRVFEIGGL